MIRSTTSSPQAIWLLNFCCVLVLIRLADTTLTLSVPIARSSRRHAVRLPTSRRAGYLVVRKPVEGGEHVSEYPGVEARVDLGGASQQRGLAETAGKHIDVGEVPGGRPVEQREELVAGEFFRGECRTGCRLGRGEVWRRVHGQVDYDCAVTVPDDQPTERTAVMDPLDAPAPPPGCSLQGVAGSRDVSRFRSGEEVEILGRSGREVLRDQGCSPGQQEARTLGQGEEQPGDLHLESSQLQLAASPGPDPRISCLRHAAAPLEAWITGVHADRTVRGSTSSSQRSSSRAPST